MNNVDLSLLPDPDDWQPIQQVWDEFVKQSPQIRISDSRFACSRFMAVHGAVLTELGVARKTGRGGWLGHRKNFTKAAFAAMHGLI